MEINQKKERDFKLKVGLGEFRVLAFNPTRDELNRLLGSEREGGEIDYLYENKNGKPATRISVWLEEVKSKSRMMLTFFLEKETAVSRTGKTQYVNAVGQSSYVDDESNLQDFFIKAMTYRKAHVGEADFMEFMRSWMTGIELNVEKGGNRNNILTDIDKFYKGNCKEIQDLVNSEFAGTVVCPVTVQTKLVDGEIKHYQKVYNKRFLPGYAIKYFENPHAEYPKSVSRFIDDMKGEFGPKEYFVLEPLRDYDPAENPVESGDTMLGSPRYGS